MGNRVRIDYNAFDWERYLDAGQPRVDGIIGTGRIGCRWRVGMLSIGLSCGARFRGHVGSRFRTR